MDKKEIIQVTIPQQGKQPLVIAFDTFFLMNDYINQHNVKSFIVQLIDYVIYNEENID